MYLFSKWFCQNSGCATLAFPVFTQFGVSLSLMIASIHHSNGVAKIIKIRAKQSKLLSSLFHGERTSCDLAEEKNVGIYCFRDSVTAL